MKPYKSIINEKINQKILNDEEFLQKFKPDLKVFERNFEKIFKPIHDKMFNYIKKTFGYNWSPNDINEIDDTIWQIISYWGINPSIRIK
jgi:hypothetical protein